MLEGVLGLLPNTTAGQVMNEMTAAIASEGGREIAENVSVHFTYRHDASVCPADHPLVTTLAGASSQAGNQAPVDAMVASLACSRTSRPGTVAQSLSTAILTASASDNGDEELTARHKVGQISSYAGVGVAWAQAVSTSVAPSTRETRLLNLHWSDNLAARFTGPPHPGRIRAG